MQKIKPDTVFTIGFSLLIMIVLLGILFPMCDRKDRKILDMNKGVYHERNHHTYTRPSGTDPGDPPGIPAESDEDIQGSW